MINEISKTMVKAALLASLASIVTCVEASPQTSPFKVIIDGGSTGSRLHIFEFVRVGVGQDGSTSTTTTTQVAAVQEPDENDVVVECIRRGSSRANIPLSAFGRYPSEQQTEDNNPLNATKVADHMLPLFEYAATVIPSEYHEFTTVKYQATAGMRLLSESEQDAVYDALYEGLMEAPSFAFRGMKRSDIATLSGELEGFYGAVAGNYLQGLVDTNMRLLRSHHEHEHGPIGALDMGGSSTQIVFLPDASRTSLASTCPNTESNNNNNNSNNSNVEGNEDETCDSPYALDGDHFFSTSYLSYGVDQFRERLWSTLVKERLDETEDESCTNKYVQNPCANKGFEVEWQGFTLIGTGDTDECIRQTRRLIPHPENPHDNHEEEGVVNQVGGVQHPPVRGKFLAMSLYFFSLDSLRVFSEPNEEAHKALNLSWPNPSIEELHNALDGLCSRDWHDDMAHQHGAHDFTRAEVLPHRCIETVFMVTLLKDGYGFHPSSRDITFTFLLDGDEVEWTLGMALSANAEELSWNEESESACNSTWEECTAESWEDLLEDSNGSFLISEATTHM